MGLARVLIRAEFVQLPSPCATRPPAPHQQRHPPVQRRHPSHGPIRCAASRRIAASAARIQRCPG
eukprot:109451-Prymnesium_polylepis.1